MKGQCEFENEQFWPGLPKYLPIAPLSKHFQCPMRVCLSLLKPLTSIFHTHTHTHTHTHRQTHTHIHTHTQIHKHRYTHRHTHSHTRTRFRPLTDTEPRTSSVAHTPRIWWRSFNFVTDAPNSQTKIGWMTFQEIEPPLLCLLDETRMHRNSNKLQYSIPSARLSPVSTSPRPSVPCHYRSRTQVLRCTQTHLQMYTNVHTRIYIDTQHKHEHSAHALHTHSLLWWSPINVKLASFSTISCPKFAH